MKVRPDILIRISALVILFAGLTQTSCIKEEGYDNDPSVTLKFSADSVLFDTVFTTLGSATRYLMVYNTGKKAIRISSVRLESGPESQFRLNVDGVASFEVFDVEIPANDSIFIFVKVRVDPTSQNSPLVVTDRILFSTNGNDQSVDLVAWGQDAHYIVADHFVQGLPPYHIVAGENQSVTWVNDKPYVVYGYAVVDSVGILNIEAGVKVHFHKGSGLWVYKG